MTRIASYLRSPMTKQCIKFLMKVDSMNESVLPEGSGHEMNTSLSFVYQITLLIISPYVSAKKMMPHK